MANARTHLLRAQSDAIMVGIGTVLADDPQLTCRLPDLEGRSPIRVVVGSRPLPSQSRLMASAGAFAVWVMRDAIAALPELAAKGINNVMVEGGAHVARSLIEADLVDRLILIRAPMTLGPQGLDAFAGLPVATVLRGFDLVEEEKLGPDRLAVYERRED
jgi:diaminohydroxyphosphoribosylaminopyrimidine deaminase/5-amino-6-(5-phosphoribosylamino)uracil reductase